MAQTTNALSGAAGYIAISTDGTTWTDVSGHAQSIEVDGGERQTGTAFTMDGDTPILTAGKRDAITVTVNVIYTETATEPYDTVNDAYEAGSSLYVRWSPGGNETGDLLFSTAAGYVKESVYPGLAADNADPLTVSIVVETTSITESTVA